MAILKVTGLTKRFDNVLALEDVSFEAERGEIVGILGPNGAGKTTLIHLIPGLIRPTSGRIEVFGMALDENRSSILARMNFASNYVSLPYSLTLWENMMVYALMYGVRDKGARIREVLALFRLLELKDRPARVLSSGQMMRLCLAKAMINRPEILLLDEPLSGLDPETARNSRELIRKLSREEGLAVLYTSHNLAEMQELSDRVLFLEKGRILMQGSSASLLGRYRVETLEELFFKVLRHES